MFQLRCPLLLRSVHSQPTQTPRLRRMPPRRGRRLRGGLLQSTLLILGPGE